jgi:hypothetical protein
VFGALTRTGDRGHLEGGEVALLTSQKWLSKRISLFSSLFLSSRYNNGSNGSNKPPPFIGLQLLSFNFYNLQCTFLSSLLRSGSHPGTRSNSNLSEATTASTKTFLTALVLNSIIAGVEISTFTLVRRYFRLVYEPRSLSVFDSCARTFLLLCLVLTFV